MWNNLKRLKIFLPSRRVVSRLVVLGSVMGLLVLSFYWGRWGALSQLKGQEVEQASKSLFPVESGDPKRPVAYIYDRLPITRQDLGEYLIARSGADTLKLLVHRKIVENVCKSQGVFVTDAEVEAQLVENLKKMNVPSFELFNKHVLKKVNKSFYEYKEDVIRPQIAMAKLLRKTVKVTEEELRDEFEAKYGPKVECRMLVLSKDQARRADKIWAEIKTDPTAWDKYMRNCYITELAANGGAVPPIHKHFGDKRFEQQAFNLKPGEISTLIPMEQDGSIVILKCVKHLPATQNKSFAAERSELYSAVFERKLNKTIPEAFKEMKDAATPQILLEPHRLDPAMVRRINNALQAHYKESQPQAPPGLSSAIGG